MYKRQNPDWVCPTAFGSVPDCGSMAWMLEKATGRLPKFIGKPEPEMALLALSLIHILGGDGDETNQ